MFFISEVSTQNPDHLEMQFVPDTRSFQLSSVWYYGFWKALLFPFPSFSLFLSFLRTHFLSILTYLPLNDDQVQSPFAEEAHPLNRAEDVTSEE